MRVELTAEWHKQGLARAIPGAYFDSGTKCWVVDDPTPRAAAVLLRVFPEQGIAHPELHRLREELGKDVRPFDNASGFDDKASAPLLTAGLAEEGLDLYPWQRYDLGYLAAVLATHGGAYLGWERGLGKTMGALALVEDVAAEHVLIVAPNTAKVPVWVAEIERLRPDLNVMVLPNAKLKRERLLEGLRVGRPRPTVMIVHYEQLALVDWVRLPKWDLTIMDEAHRIRNAGTKMAKAAKRVPSRMRLALSGSIIMNEAEELFSPLQWLFPKVYRSKWRDWNDRYLDYAEGGYGKVCIGVKPDRLDAMRKELGVFMVYRRKSEVALPPLTEQTLLVNLGPRQSRAYAQLQDQYITELDNGTLVAATDGMTLLGKLRQVATGMSLVGDEFDDSAKLDLAMDLIRDSDDPVLVFGWYKESVRALQRRLDAEGIDTVLVDGDVKQADRDTRIASFTAGEGRVFLGTIKTLGESVNLQRASQVIFLDRSFNPGDNAQAQDRSYRHGQKNPVTVTHLVARDTVDELRILPIIATKEQLRRVILGGKG